MVVATTRVGSTGGQIQRVSQVWFALIAILAVVEG